MGSRLAPGLFFAGEILDVDGDTGGYNLQAAFSTGRLAGLNVARFALHPGTPAEETTSNDPTPRRGRRGVIRDF
jgi:succinate dehydrogenase/fumarate reductase flavoprotein subunit